MFFNRKVEIVQDKYGNYIKAPGLLRSSFYVVAPPLDDDIWENTLENFADELVNFKYYVLASEHFPYRLYRIEIRSKYAFIMDKIIKQYMYRLSVIDSNYTFYTQTFWGAVFAAALLGSGDGGSAEEEDSEK